MKILKRSTWAIALAILAACSTAPKAPSLEASQPSIEASKEIAQPDQTTTAPSPQPQDIKWEEECLVYPKQDALRGLQGSGIRRNCTASEAPESVRSVLTEGLAADERTALGLARIVLTRVYGERVVDSAQPTITAKGDRWLVQWEVQAPETKPDALKRLSVEIVKKTGAVSRMFVSVVKE